MQFPLKLVLFSSLIALSGIAQSQAPQFIGSGVLKRVWIETGVGVIVAPVTDFDSGATGCTSYSSAVLPFTHPNFKEVYAALLAAYAIGAPVDSFIVGCWGTSSSSAPALLNVGVGSI